MKKYLKKLMNKRNDAKHVVWALFHGLCLPIVKWYLNTFVSNNKTRNKKIKSYEWPKRRKTCRLGLFSSSEPATHSYRSSPMVCQGVEVAAATATVSIIMVVVVVVV